MTNSSIEKVGSTPAERPAPKAAARRKPANKKIPEGARKPADHQSAKNDVVEPKIRTIEWGTKAGEPNDDGTPGERVPATYQIDPLSFDDIDFIEAMIDMEGQPEARQAVYAYKALRTLLGPEQLAEYKINEKDPETRRTPFSGTVPFFNHILTELDQGNS